ncbi:hypothetical protein HPP92_003970 [Vanilla planifolia]|uniref:Uncharacterized protein n=1 Tax=Vanilla planifolia TaxID=51239 RepID=A0A835SHQ7_VANPL|nr:hypothetical protein HPP92_003970 [Vanilla planifolia]
MERGLERESMVCDRDEECKLLECDVEFKPIAHPMEPPEEDQPAKCPMPDSSLVCEVEGMSKESLADKMLNMGEPSSENEESITLQTDRKRRHKVDEDSSTQTPLRGLQNNLFHVFQQCKDFSP